jgi:hypothetical protein
MLGLVHPAPPDRWCPHILVLLSQCSATIHGQGHGDELLCQRTGVLLAEVRRCTQGSSSSAGRHQAPRVGAAARSLRRPKPELAAAEAELACGQVPSSPRPREACGSPGGARRQPCVELPAPEAIVGVARSSRQPWAEHKRISPVARRRAPRALGEARRRGHGAPHTVVRPPSSPAPRRPVADRRSPPPRALLRVRSRRNAPHVPPPRPICDAPGF